MICTIFFPSQTLAMKGKSVLAQNGIPSAPTRLHTRSGCAHGLTLDCSLRMAARRFLSAAGIPHSLDSV